MLHDSSKLWLSINGFDMGWNRGGFNQSTIWPVVIKTILFAYGCLCVDASHQKPWFAIVMFWSPRGGLTCGETFFFQRTLGFRIKWKSLFAFIMTYSIVVSWVCAFKAIDTANLSHVAYCGSTMFHLSPIVLWRSCTWPWTTMEVLNTDFCSRWVSR